MHFLSIHNPDLMLSNNPWVLVGWVKRALNFLPLSSHQIGCQKPQLWEREKRRVTFGVTWRSDGHRVCRLTIWIKTALKLQGQLVRVIAANPGFVSALPHRKWSHCFVLFWFATDVTLTSKAGQVKHYSQLILPAARMNWPSFDTLIEVHTVGISKSWMSSILRWMSLGKIMTSLDNDIHVKDSEVVCGAKTVWTNSPTSFFCSCLFFRSDSHYIRESKVDVMWILHHDNQQSRHPLRQYC